MTFVVITIGTWQIVAVPVIHRLGNKGFVKATIPLCRTLGWKATKSDTIKVERVILVLRKHVEERRWNDLVAALREAAQNLHWLHNDIESLLRLLQPRHETDGSINNAPAAGYPVDASTAGATVLAKAEIVGEFARRYHREQKASSRLQWFLFSVGVLTFLAVAAYAGITAMQWRAMTNQNTTLSAQVVAARISHVDPVCYRVHRHTNGLCSGT
jgi:hypothetical protein